MPDPIATPQGASPFTAAMKLMPSAEALAALGAHLRTVDEPELSLPGDVAAALRELARSLGIDPGAPRDERLAAVGMIRALLRQALDLVEAPDRAPGWTAPDPELLEAQGRMSIGVAHALADASPSLGDLATRLASDDGAFLDVGCGVGWLAITMARRFPRLRVGALDRFDAALRLAERHVHEERLQERVRLIAADVQELAEQGAYDAVWLPGPFLGREVVGPALHATARALRPGGWVLFGMYGGPEDALSRSLADLRSVRSGGHPWTAPELVSALEAAGLPGAHELSRTWTASLRLVVAQKPG